MRFGKKASWENARKCVMLAPDRSQIPDRLRQIEYDRDQYTHVLSRMQKFRGSEYLRDGAISHRELDEHGRHVQAADSSSWHVVMLAGEGAVVGCTKFRKFRADAVAFDTLGVRSSPLANCETWRSRLTDAVSNEIGQAQRSGQAYMEIGGWAAADEIRHTADSIFLALVIFGFGRLLGGCRGISTATVRNNSAGILRRLGGRSLRSGHFEIPRYYDASYGCEMEILAFDSGHPNVRFESCIDEICDELREIRIICRDDPEPEYHVSTASAFSGMLSPLPA